MPWPFPVLHNQVTHHIQQWTQVYSLLPFAADTPVGVLAAFHIPLQIQLQVDFGFPDPTSPCLDSVLLELLTLLLPFVCFLFKMCVLSGAPSSSIWSSCHLLYPAHWDKLLLRFKEVLPGKNNQLSWTPCSPELSSMGFSQADP